MNRDYIPVTETAKYIRKALKKAFPGVKFSVRTDKYAGGSSIRVAWTDGPAQKAVEAVACQYQDGGFDGMIDMKYHMDHWLLPDGSAVIADNPGTENSAGVHPASKNEKPHPDARRVSFGGDFVFCNREISEAWIEKCRQAWEQLSGREQCDLLNNYKFPRLRDCDNGENLARFLSVPS